MNIYVIYMLYILSLLKQNERNMKTFKNKNFKTRNYECTNLVFCQAENAPSENWIECDELELECSNCEHLYIQNGVRYFGYL